MSYLVDTNFLLRLVQNTSPLHQDARNALLTLQSQGETLIITPQNVFEFWVVATRPLEVNGLGLSVEFAAQQISQMKQLFTLQADTSEMLTIWEQLVIKYQVKGKQAHDARLVAAMIVHQVTHFLTFNIADFQRFAEITAIAPRTVTTLGSDEDKAEKERE
jgi:predicted nucleic acid-binding protein